MSKFLAGKRLATVAERTEGPAAVLSLRKAVKLITGGKGEHDGEGVVHVVLHDCITERGVGMLVYSFRGEEIVGVFEL